MARSHPDDTPERDDPAPPARRGDDRTGACAPAAPTFGQGRYRDIDWALI